MGTACQMFLLGRHCRARTGRVLCDPVVLCSPVQSSVLFVPTERLPPSPSQLTPHSAHSEGPKPLSLGGKKKNGRKRRTFYQPSFPSVFLYFFPFLKCFSQFVSSIYLWTDVPKNFTVKLVTKTTVLLTWKFSDSRFPYRCMVSNSCCVISFVHPVQMSTCQTLIQFTCFVNNLSTHILPQIEYNRQKVDIDARMTKTLITNLRPNVTYEFRITCQESSDGGPKHKLIARTAPPILVRKPELDLKREPDSTLTIVFPPLENKDLIK